MTGTFPSDKVKASRKAEATSSSGEFWAELGQLSGNIFGESRPVQRRPGQNDSTGQRK